MLTTNQVIAACRKALERHYGERFRGLILYGSLARNDADAWSDIDLLVLLSQPFDYVVELRRIVDLLYPIQLDSPRLISAKPALFDAYERGDWQLYRSARQEGVAV